MTAGPPARVVGTGGDEGRVALQLVVLSHLALTYFGQPWAVVIDVSPPVRAAATRLAGRLRVPAPSAPPAPGSAGADLLVDFGAGPAATTPTARTVLHAPAGAGALELAAAACALIERARGDRSDGAA